MRRHGYLLGASAPSTTSRQQCPVPGNRAFGLGCGALRGPVARVGNVRPPWRSISSPWRKCRCSRPRAVCTLWRRDRDTYESDDEPRTGGSLRPAARADLGRSEGPSTAMDVRSPETLTDTGIVHPRRRHVAPAEEASSPPTTGALAHARCRARNALLVTDDVEWCSVLGGWAGLPTDCPVCGGRRCQREDCLDRWHEPWWEAWERRVPVRPDGRAAPWWRWPKDLQAELFATWEAVLDVRGSRAVQGCTEYVAAEWVTDAVRLISA